MPELSQNPTSCRFTTLGEARSETALAMMFRGREQRRIWLDGGASRHLLLRLSLTLPLAALFALVLLLTFFCHRMLCGIASGESGMQMSTAIFLSAGGFLVASMAVVVLQASRVAQRVAGPEYRLRQSLQRIRGGDISFRIHLRKGDMLVGLAQECNELLDWLNRCPPPGCKTGTDVFDVSPDHLLDEQPALNEELARQ